MPAVRRRRPAQAARWNGSPQPSTTGTVSARATHSQPGNWRAEIIDSARTGADSAAAIASRTVGARPEPASASSCAAHDPQLIPWSACAMPPIIPLGGRASKYPGGVVVRFPP